MIGIVGWVLAFSCGSAVDPFPVGHEAVAEQRHLLLLELLLHQAAVVDALHLNADFFVQAC